MLFRAIGDVRKFDVVHVHMARDLVTLPVAAIARFRGVPYVVQAHGMIDRSTKPLARLLDAVLVRRVLRSARRLFVLTEKEEADVGSVLHGRSGSFERLANGIRVDDLVLESDRHTSTPEVLFCSRLHPRKRPVLFADMALTLLSEGAVATFAMVGPDEGELAAVEERLASSPSKGALRWEDGLEPADVSGRLSRAALVVLPSANEPFPMIVLEALASGCPVVVTDQCGLARFVGENHCGLVVPTDDLPRLTDAVRYLIEHRTERLAMGRAGHEAVKEQLSIARVAEQLEHCYEGLIRGCA
jgi:glycosyltransferase involved in cell wall biosynthesis